jgi:hypothetical protein
MKDFPQEVIEKMLERQEEQGNRQDVTVFERDPQATDYRGGFNWTASPEGYSFWVEVIEKNNFDLFFEKYPKIHSHELKVYFETDGYSELFCTFEREEDYDLLHKEIVKIAKSKNFTRVTEAWE